MEIKPLKESNDSQELIPVDISDWNKEVKGFIRPLSGQEQLIFNDYFLDFFNRDLPVEKRFDAGLKAASMALVDENGKQLVGEESRAALWEAFAVPFLNIFSTVMNVKIKVTMETAKKN